MRKKEIEMKKNVLQCSAAWGIIPRELIRHSTIGA